MFYKIVNSCNKSFFMIFWCPRLRALYSSIEIHGRMLPCMGLMCRICRFSISRFRPCFEPHSTTTINLSSTITHFTSSSDSRKKSSGNRTSDNRKQESSSKPSGHSCSCNSTNSCSGSESRNNRGSIWVPDESSNFLFHPIWKC